tara:strand:- start:1410 stop:1847 length:438 start_codon:yes stop_codon:yes gene_type:complete
MKAKVKTWIENVENGNFKSYSERVLNEIKKNTPEMNGTYIDFIKKGISTYQLRDKLNISHQTLTSRLSELNDEGLIKVVGQIVIDEINYSIYAYVRDLNEQTLISTSRRLEKYMQWLKKADSFMDLMGFKTAKMIQYEQINYNCH